MRLLIFNYFSLRALLLRIKNKKISILSLFDKKTKISRYCRINRFTIIRNSKIDDYTFIGPNSNVLNTSIGKYCSISKNVNLGAPIHPIHFFSTSPIFYRQKNGTGFSWIDGQTFDDSSRDIIIGNDVWIGLNVSIMGGITISDGAIIAAHSVVTKDVPPYAIYGGIPAKLIKYRFNTEIIANLLELEWWSFPKDRLRKYAPVFASKVDIETIERIKSLI